MKEFLLKKNIEITPKRYFIDAMGAMAYALFATLLVGTILKTIGDELDISFLKNIVWPLANQATGPAIALAIAFSLKAPQLVMFSSTIVGISAYQIGGPLGVFLSTIFAVEIGKLVAGETRVDIILTPIITVLVGVGVAQIIGPSVMQIMKWIGEIIMIATESNPFVMSIIIAIVIGLVLTLPISSAALCLMLELDGLAAGAATIGCCAQMIGFATISFKDNGIGGLLAQGLGTSMVQMPNIYKNWKIWIPPTLAAGVIGPIAIIFFQMTNSSLESGMGTCGFVGQIGTFNAMKSSFSSTYILITIIGLQFLLPALLSFLFYIILKKWNWIKDGDMKIN
ncbi:PTS transporter subunit IIC [Faecalibacter rhinopitheci]|uniref:PTS sugar transporter subunit IIC n=1 Tax=Faecalibacter rhinopitheci TaxID=2779678 RepID=A0A8J7KAB6_9FLAO|nr:PTS sugar transporter subunit IIC [Faecalibacter rhinopitheci]MBF0597310.1 PTS sugar transporter subunit IIC [Faecalibacter rhinopitheci]MBQ0146927.1 PTS sugar transporter subunit IIC [Candidatus Onthonaster equi]